MNSNESTKHKFLHATTLKKLGIFISLQIYVSIFSAEDWNLAKPLQTCSLLVERRDDILFVEFLLVPPSSTTTPQQQLSSSQTTVFAVSQIDLSSTSPNPNIQYYVEQVVDSSRYYSIKIMGTGGKQATIGFGFRERDESIDFKEAIQYYEQSMKRSTEAETSTKLSSFTVPKLADGEKIHIQVSKKKDGDNDKKLRQSSPTGSSVQKKTTSGLPLLLKKPPPPSSSVSSSSISTNPSDQASAAALVDSDCIPTSLSKGDDTAIQSNNVAATTNHLTTDDNAVTISASGINLDSSNVDDDFDGDEQWSTA